MNTRWTDRLPLLIALGLVTHLAFMLYAYSVGYLQRLESWIVDIDGNPQGLLVSASDNNVRLWRQQRCITTLVSPQDKVRCLSLSVDGAILASGGVDHSILLWSVAEARPIRRLLGHHKPVTQVCISPNRQWLISQSEDSTLCIWRLPAGKLIKRFATQNMGFSLNSSNELAYCDRQANLVVVDLKTQVVLWKTPQVMGKPLFSPTGDQLAWIDTASHCSIFNPFTHQRIVSFSLGTHTSWTLGFTPDSKQLLVCKWGGVIELWDWRLAKRLTQFNAYTMAAVVDLRFDELDQLQTAGNGSIKYWDLSSQRLLFSVGDGTYRQVLLNWLGFWVMLSLAVSYVVLGIANDPTSARYTILGVLTVWTLGLILLIDQVRSSMVSWALGGLWTMASLTLLSLVVYYFSFITLVSIPFGFYFGYVYLLRRSPSRWSYSVLPLIILLASTVVLANSLDSILYYVQFLLG
jgi:WD40 repeat protein